MKNINKISLIKNSLPTEFTSEEASRLLSPHYKAPQKVLEELVARGELIRLKKGLFVAVNQYDPLAAAGSIHGPSYLSFETALGFYSLIPERVNAIMSVTDNRQLRLAAGGHLYIYRSQERKLFARGMTAVTLNGRNVLIATPEKAVLDTIAWTGLNTRSLSQSEVFESICSSYRFDQDELWKLSARHLKELGPMYRSRAPMMFVSELVKMKTSGKAR